MPGSPDAALTRFPTSCSEETEAHGRTLAPFPLRFAASPPRGAHPDFRLSRQLHEGPRPVGGSQRARGARPAKLISRHTPVPRSRTQMCPLPHTHPLRLGAPPLSSMPPPPGSPVDFSGPRGPSNLGPTNLSSIAPTSAIILGTFEKTGFTLASGPQGQAPDPPYLFSPSPGQLS